MDRPAPRDAGMSLVEVVVALFVFGLLSSAVVGTLTRTLDLTVKNDRRAVALNLAARQVETARATRASELVSLPSQTLRVDGADYTLTQEVQPLPASGGSACDSSSSGAISARRVSVSVTWAGMGQLDPVRSDTIKALTLEELQPDRGALSVKVVDRDGRPAAGHTITLTPGGTTATTTADGCAVFSGLLPGSGYAVRLGTAGHVDAGGASAPQRSGLVVQASALTKDPGFVYDRAGSLTVAPVVPPGHVLPTGVGVSLSNLSVSGSARAHPPCSSGAPAPCADASRTVAGLFPAALGWEAWVGTCADARPASPAATALAPGGSAVATPPVAAFELRLRTDDGVPASRSVTAYHPPDSRCPLGETLSVGTGSVLRGALPAGRWFLGTDTSTYVDVTLVAGAEPPVLTLTVGS